MFDTPSSLTDDILLKEHQKCEKFIKEEKEKIEHMSAIIEKVAMLAKIENDRKAELEKQLELTATDSEVYIYIVKMISKLIKDSSFYEEANLDWMADRNKSEKEVKRYSTFLKVYEERLQETGAKVIDFN